LGVALHPEVSGVLGQLLEDEKMLAKLDPARGEAYRARFERGQKIRKRLEILRWSREEMVRRYEYAVAALLAGVLAGGGVLVLLWRRRSENRLRRIQVFLDDLAQGRGDIRIGEAKKDTIGRIATMIEDASRRAAKDRKRLDTLEHLASWQEAARRHAHEIRTPLTAAQMEADRLLDLVRPDRGEVGPEATSLVNSIREELARLRRFTHEFTSFARIGRPQLRPEDLYRLVEEFCRTFAEAWPSMNLEPPETKEAVPVRVDPEMIRQVLVNLCTNSALALDGRPGKVHFQITRTGATVRLRVGDDGPGIAPSVRDRLFEPYTTTRKIGEGMGLGLAISRKILLDHDGDLELEATSAAGTVFRIVLPRAGGDRL
jgi:signal transduction histidine kinase